MQIQHFTNGSSVVHKARVGDSPMRFSLWFSPQGILVDGEALDAAGRPRTLTARQRALADSGRVWSLVEADRRRRAASGGGVFGVKGELQ